LKFSIIIPLYNRPQEIEELLECLCHQTYKNFEVWVIEDGSTLKADSIVESFSKELDVHYLFKENTGQGLTRNVGFEHAKGDYFIIFDSDILLDKDYLQIVSDAIQAEQIDCYGGPDKEHSSFTPTQKAISYAMTSIFTTGGIRGGKQHVGKFTPRSFNMGLSRKVYEQLGGFAIPRMAEDLEYSIRIQKAGFKTALIPEAHVYHKRRTSLAQFFKQLKFFGRARINLYRFTKQN
jgi:glycosyltransferase involved in cell wall biosynthesis